MTDKIIKLLSFTLLLFAMSGCTNALLIKDSGLDHRTARFGIASNITLNSGVLEIANGTAVGEKQDTYKRFCLDALSDVMRAQGMVAKPQSIQSWKDIRKSKWVDSQDIDALILVGGVASPSRHENYLVFSVHLKDGRREYCREYKDEKGDMTDPAELKGYLARALQDYANAKTR